MIITLRNYSIPSPQFRKSYALVKLEDGSQEEKKQHISLCLRFI